MRDAELKAEGLGVRLEFAIDQIRGCRDDFQAFTKKVDERAAQKVTLNRGLQAAIVTAAGGVIAALVAALALLATSGHA